MKPILNVAQLVIAVILIMAILIQNKGAGLGGVFGGEGNVYRTKRGAEKLLFVLTIVFSILFLGTATLNLLIK